METYCPECNAKTELHRGRYYCYECDDIVEDPEDYLQDEWRDNYLSWGYDD